MDISRDKGRQGWGKALRSLSLGLLGLLPLAGQALAQQTAAQPVLRIQGSNTVGAKLAPMLVAELFKAEGFTDVAIRPTGVENEQQVSARDAQGQPVIATVAAHGSGTGFVGLKNGTTDLAASSRPIKDSELASLASLGDLKSMQAEQVVAIDGLAIIVHPSNPMQSISSEQLARLFAGQVKNWAEIGGADLSVRLHARDDMSGTYDTFKELVLASHSTSLHSSALRYESNDELSAAVVGDPGAVGFVGLASVGRAKALAITDGNSLPMFPETTTVATEDYPLSRRLFFYANPSSHSDWVRRFIDFAHSDAGQAVVVKAGYIAQNIQAVTQTPSQSMPAAYRQLAREAKRLTVNFRFDDGSARLDNKAQRDIDRVIAYLRENDLLRQRAVLVGFGDSNLDPSRAALISRLRAMAVRRELVKGGVIFKEISGLGDELPVASNDEANGRIRNRRVEIWVY